MMAATLGAASVDTGDDVTSAGWQVRFLRRWGRPTRYWEVPHGVAPSLRPEDVDLDWLAA